MNPLAMPSSNQPLNGMSDDYLLRRYTVSGSRLAFDRLVERHRRMVYTICRREIGDTALAEDATQAVFLILARKANRLHGSCLPGWLFQTARLTSKNALQREGVRQRQEQTLMARHAREVQTGPPHAPWENIEPLLNGALASLKRSDREALLLRFFEGLSFAEAGAALRVSEDAARMRVTRALERLRRHLIREGVAISALTLAAILSEKATEAASPFTLPLISGPIGAAVAGPNGLGAQDLAIHALMKGTLKDMLQMKIQMAALMALGLGMIGTGAVVVHAQRVSLPKPLFSVASSTIPPEASQAILAQMKKKAEMENTRTPNPAKGAKSSQARQFDPAQMTKNKEDAEAQARTSYPIKDTKSAQAK